MASTYTPGGIELIADGEKANTWGQITNDNWELIEEMVSGVQTINIGGLSSYTLTTSDGVSSNGRHAVIVFIGAISGTVTITVSPSDLQKVYIINNDTNSTLEITQGSGSSVTMAAQSKKIIYCNGAGSSASVVDVIDGLDVASLSLGGTEVTASAAELNILDGVTASTAELNHVDGVTSNIQTQLNNKQPTITGAATSIDDANLTQNRALISDGLGKVAVSAVTSTELGYLDGVTSNIQTQINNIEAGVPNIDGAASTIVADNLTFNRALISDASGKVAVSEVTSTELNYLDSVSSNIQTQLDSKLSAPSLAGNVVLVSDSSGNIDDSTITTTELGYLDNVSSNIQTQLNAKASTTSPSFSGDITVNSSTVGRGGSNRIQNNAFGYQALEDNTNGVYNVAYGYGALKNNTIGNNNVAIGVETLAANIDGDQNIAIGRNALAASSQTNNIAVGFNAQYSSTSGSNNVSIGTQTLLSNVSGSYCVAIGTQTLESNLANSITAVGFQALQNNTTGASNNAFGSLTLPNNTTGSNNTAVGSAALRLNTTGSDNTAVGPTVLYDFSSGDGNTGVGSAALRTLTSASANTAVGYRALHSCSTGAGNTVVGHNAGLYLLGTANTAIGRSAMQGAAGQATGNYNLAVGDLAMRDLTTGSGNLAFGSKRSNGDYTPIFNITSQNDIISMGHTDITNAYCKATWENPSDIRDKTNISDLTIGLAFVNQLKPKSYQYRASREDDTPHGPVRYGFIAQDVLQLEGDNPVVMNNINPDALTYNSANMIPILANAIKELSAQVTALQAEIDALKNGA